MPSKHNSVEDNTRKPPTEAFGAAANVYAQFDYLRELKGEERIQWLLSLDGEHLDKASDAEWDVTLSIIAGLPIKTLYQMEDLDVHKARMEMNGVSEEEKIEVRRRLKALEEGRADWMEKQIRNFLADPYKHMPSSPENTPGTPWNKALKALDLLLETIPEGDTRLTKMEPERIHFIEPVMDFIESLKDGLLPARVTEQNLLDSIGNVVETVEVPKAHQSIEHLITVFFLHDIVENYGDEGVSYDYLRNYMVASIPADLSEEEQEFETQEIDYIVDCVRSFTYKHDVLMPNNTVLKNQSEHKNKYEEPDLNVYAHDMQPYWPVLVGKGKDRKNGLKGRHPYHVFITDYFSLEKDRTYNEDTISVLKHGQLLEKAKKIFPALKGYVKALNSQADLIHRRSEFLLLNHPRGDDTKRKAKATSASLDITDAARKVKKIRKYSRKIGDIRDQHYSHIVEAFGHPNLRDSIRGTGHQLHLILEKGMARPRYPQLESNDNSPTYENNALS